MSPPQPFALQLESRRMEEWLYNSFDINPKIFTCQWGLGRHLLLSSFFCLRTTQTFTSSCYDRFNVCLSDSHPGSQSIERCLIDKLNIRLAAKKATYVGPIIVNCSFYKVFEKAIRWTKLKIRVCQNLSIN